MMYSDLLNLDFRTVKPAQGQSMLGIQALPMQTTGKLNLGFGSPSSLLGDNPLGLSPTPTLDFFNVKPDVDKSGGLMGFLNNNAKGISAGTGLLTGLLGGYLGMKQLGLAKKQYEFEKDAFNKQYAAQRTILNADMRDRQQARVTARPWAAQAVKDYMKQNEVK
jgi:hypothetical protein